MTNDSVGAGDVLLGLINAARDREVARAGFNPDGRPENVVDQTTTPDLQGPAIETQPEFRNQLPAWVKPAGAIAGVLAAGFIAKKAGLL